MSVSSTGPSDDASATARQLELLREIKSGQTPLRIPISNRGIREAGHLAPLTEAHLQDEALIERFVRWRNQFRAGWLDQRPVTVSRTRRWLCEVLTNPTRISFLIYHGDTIVGRCGFLNLTAKRNESDGLVRGERGGGIDFMHAANVAGLEWQFDELGMRAVYSKVLSTNEAALEGCRRLGYRMPPLASRPVYRHVHPEGIVLGEVGNPEQEVPGVRLLYLVIHVSDFNQATAQWRRECRQKRPS